MRLKQAMALIATLSGLIGSANADSFYGVFSVGYVQNDNQTMEVNSPSYKLGVGYQIAPQWYIETGFQLLAEENVDSTELAIDEQQLEASGIFIAALGKAVGQSGELFYRVGVMKADLKGQYQATGPCQSNAQLSTVGGDGLTVCRFDDGILAGVVGLGYDFYISPSLLVRAEAEHIRGESDYSANAFYVGLRVNF